METGPGKQLQGKGHEAFDEMHIRICESFQRSNFWLQRLHLTHQL